ncbi:polymer-forming cytoskeletal protein [Flavobacterium sp. LaA7.5]|nr:polymer-forming cytoskeletal protein [Flavobacterium salilacus subsp. altitudinum]
MIFKWRHKIYSGALQFTIFIAVIIALLLAAAVILFYTHRFFLEQSKSSIQNIQLSDSGIMVLKGQDEINRDTLSIAVPGKEINQSIRTHLSHWGIYEKAWVQSIHRKKEFTKCSFLGSSIPADKCPSLYLKDMAKPLVVVGNTKITGKAILPQKGVKTGSIAGHSYYGTSLIYGNVAESTPELPKLKYNYGSILDYYLNEFMPEQDNFISLSDNAVITNSFNAPVKGIASQQEIVLENISITGNIIIRSADKITVRNTAKLKDIILTAPIIEVEDGVTGNFQAIATTTIKIGSRCKLNYPSALVMVEEEPDLTQPYNKFQNKIYISEGTVLKGTLCFLERPKENDYKVNIYVDSSVTVKGEIYCEGNLELKGNVIGTVYTNQFVANERGTIFVNHLYDATISSAKLPEAFGGLLFENEVKTVMKWLY